MLVGGFYYDDPNDKTTLQQLDTVAMFNLNSKEWKICRSYPRPVIQPTLVFLNNRVYAFGGREFRPNKKWTNTRRVQVIDVSEFSAMNDALWVENQRLESVKCRSPVVVPYNPL